MTLKPLQIWTLLSLKNLDEKNLNRQRDFDSMIPNLNVFL